MPLVSIGVPVYNGEQYLSQALDSLLAQTFQDMEILVCDNASTDTTERICREYAQRDPRIRYVRNETNIGAGPNFNKAFALSTGKYFKWAAHDDLCAPEFVARCVDVMERDNTVAVCTSNIVWIDEHGDTIRRVAYPLDKADSTRPHERFSQMSSTNHGCFDVFGLIRRDVLARTALIDSFIGSDRALLAHLSLLGRVYRIDEDLFFSRDHSQRSIRALRLRDRSSWWDPALVGKPAYPWWRLLGAYVAILRSTPMARATRIRCYASLVVWCRYGWRCLGGEVMLWIASMLAPRRAAPTSESQVDENPGSL
ncbi:MAG: glycosyltransferase [Chitinivibrionales bacterium]|nr:glycosyltransferase [Chitinivibrionales bacterium]